MPDWLQIDTDPFAAPARAPPRTSFTINPSAPPPATRADAPREPSATNWSQVDHAPEFHDTAPEEPAEPQKGFWETAKEAGQSFGADLHRQRSAASQGTTPNLAAHEKNLLSETTGESEEGNLRYQDSEGKWHDTDTNKHVALRGDDGKIRVYNRTEDTDEGRMSAAGRLMMTGMATETPRLGTAGLKAGTRILGIGSRGERLPADIHPAWVPQKTSEAVQAAERQGIDLPKAIATESGTVKYLGQVMKGSPFGTPMREAIEQGQQGERGLAGAMERVGTEAGGMADPKLAGEGVTTGIEKVFSPETQKRVGQLYDHVDSMVNPKKVLPPGETQAAVADILAKRQAYNNDRTGPVIDMVADAFRRPGGLTYEATKDLRTEIRQLKEKGETGGLLPENTSQQDVEKIYKALTKDLGNIAEHAGGPAARTAWEAANRASKSRVDVLETLEKVLGSDKRSDEGVMATLRNMAGTGAGADVKTLLTARRAVQGLPGAIPGSPGAWENVASTVISGLGKNNKGEFSPALFIRDYNNLSQQGKAILFSGVGKSDLIGALDDIAKVSDKYVQAGKLANTSGTAGHATAAAALMGAFGALIKGDFKTPAEVAVGLLGGNVVSRMLGSPATAASLARWQRAMDNLVHTPNARAWAAYSIASRNLGNTTAAAGGNPDAAPHLINQLQGAVRRPGESNDQQQ